MSEWRAGDTVARRYELCELVAEAPAGAWSRALDREAGAEVALLRVRAELVPDADSQDRFMGAVVEMRGILHPHLLRVMDVGRADGAVYLTAALHQPVQLAGALRPLLEQLAHVARALDAVHDAGQVHGRLTPGDIVDVDGAVCVRGAGLYIETDAAARAWQDLARFWAPEVARGDRPTPAADVYSLAVICVEALTGRVPDDPRRLPAELAARLPALDAVLAPALSPAPDARPGSPGALIQRLDAALADLPAGGAASAAPAITPASERTLIDSIPAAVLGAARAARGKTRGPTEGKSFAGLPGADDEATEVAREPPAGRAPRQGDTLRGVAPAITVEDERTERSPAPEPDMSAEPDVSAADDMSAEPDVSAADDMSAADEASDPAGAPVSRALPFVSMKPPSVQGKKKRTPVIPAIERPEMVPRIRATTQPPRHPTVRPGSLGHYAPPRSPSRESRRRRMWLSMAAAAVIGVVIAMIAIGLVMRGPASDHVPEVRDPAPATEAPRP